MDVADLNVTLVDHEISDLLGRWTGAENTHRRAVTRRASRIFAPEPGFRKQEAAKSGQTCVEQFEAAALTSSRSPLAKTVTSPASTLAAKLDNAIVEAPRSASIAKAERDLSILGLLTRYRDAVGDLTSNNLNEKQFHQNNLYLCHRFLPLWVHNGPDGS